MLQSIILRDQNRSCKAWHFRLSHLAQQGTVVKAGAVFLSGQETYSYLLLFSAIMFEL